MVGEAGMVVIDALIGVLKVGAHTVEVTQLQGHPRHYWGFFAGQLEALLFKTGLEGAQLFFPSGGEAGIEGDPLDLAPAREEHLASDIVYIDVVVLDVTHHLCQQARLVCLAFDLDVDFVRVYDLGALYVAIISESS